MQQEFDKELQEQAAKYSIEPRQAVWRNIEAALPQKNPTRIAGWWWALPLVLMVGGGIAWWASDNFAHQTASKPEISTPDMRHEETIPDKKTSTLPNKSVNSSDNVDKPTPANATTKVTEAQINHRPNENYQIPTTPNTNPNPADSYKHTERPTRPFLKAKPTIVIAQQDEANKAKPNALLDSTDKKYASTTMVAAKSGMDKKPDFVPSQAQTSLSATSIDRADNPTGVTAVPENEKQLTPRTGLKTSDAVTTLAEVQKPDTTYAAAVQPAAKAIRLPKEVQWLVQLRVGMSSLAERTRFTMQKEMLYADYAALNSSLGYSSAVVGPFVPNKTDISAGLSLARKQPINNRMYWQAAAGYHYLSISQTMGRRKDSSFTLQSTQSAATKSASYYYYSGSGYSSSGSMHQADVSVQLGYKFIKKKNYFVSLEPGLGLSYAISQKYLVPDYAKYRWIDGSAYQKKAMAHAGLALTGGTQGMQFSLGWQAGLSPAFKPISGKNQYWSSTYVQVQIPLTIKK